MSMSDTDFQAWLESPSAVFTFLVEVSVMVNGVESTVYLSTNAYRTSPSDPLPNVNYEAIASIGVLFSEQLTLDNSDSSIGAGQLEIDNYDGSHDSWFSYVWDNRSIKVYVGDVRWARSDFRMVFNGIVADIAPSGRQKIVLKLRDRLQQINTAVSDVKVGGTSQYKDDIVPVCFGENHNVTPILENPATLVYRVHTGVIFDIPEVRDNGVPLKGVSAPVLDRTTGRFRLSSSPAGTITATVQGDKATTYVNTCAALVKRIVTGFGDVSKRLALTDIDTANFDQFDTVHPQPMGSYCSDRTNVLDLCRMLTGSLGSQIYFTSQGLLRIVQLTLPPTGTTRNVTSADMGPNSLVPANRTAAVGAVKLGFCKNWTVQDGLTSGIPQGHKDLFAKEWLTSSKSDATVQSSRRLSGEPTQQDTMLLRRVDADNEAQRQLDLWKVPRMVYEFDGLPQLFMLELGQAITVFSDRYGMAGGVTGTVVSLARNWSNRRVKVGFIV